MENTINGEFELCPYSLFIYNPKIPFYPINYPRPALCFFNSDFLQQRKPLKGIIIAGESTALINITLNLIVQVFLCPLTSQRAKIY